jgi:hypothetical protein
VYRQLVVAALAVVVTSCGEPAGLTTAPIRREYIATALADPELDPVSRLFLEVEAQAPGFAGLYVGDDQRLNIQLVDPSQRGLTEAVLRNLLRVRKPQRNIDSFVFHQVAYSYSQLHQWNAQGRSEFLTKGQGSGVWVRRNRIAVGAEDAAAFGQSNRRQ